jgi:hypothetical protein
MIMEQKEKEKNNERQENFAFLAGLPSPINANDGTYRYPEEYEYASGGISYAKVVGENEAATSNFGHTSSKTKERSIDYRNTLSDKPRTRYLPVLTR